MALDWTDTGVREVGVAKLMRRESVSPITPGSEEGPSSGICDGAEADCVFQQEYGPLSQSPDAYVLSLIVVRYT